MLERCLFILNPITLLNLDVHGPDFFINDERNEAVFKEHILPFLVTLFCLYILQVW